jgi:hypothetical protein
LAPTASGTYTIDVNFLTGKFTVTFVSSQTVPLVALPASGVLYITGAATAGGWVNTPPANQQFTQVSTTDYQITIPLIGGQEYDFLPTYGSWTDKYAIAVTDDPTEVNGGVFQVQGSNILAPAVSGTYLIDVNFETGKFTVTLQ